MLEGMGRAIASNPMTPYGRVKTWLKELSEMPEGKIRPDYQTLRRIHRLLRSIAREELRDKELTPPQTRIHSLRPSKRSLQLLREACNLSKTVTPGGSCWLDGVSSYMAFLNELSALVHTYEALTQPLRLSRVVFASEDASEWAIREALTWEECIFTLHRRGYVLTNPELFFAIAMKDRLDVRNGESPGHLTKIFRTHALYTDGDLDVVYAMGHIHGRLGKKAPLLNRSKVSLNEFYFPKTKERPSLMWALPNGMDLRNLYFYRLFQDAVKVLNFNSTPGKILETLRDLSASYTPYFERKALIENTDRLEEAIELLALHVADYLNETDPETKRELFLQGVGKASGVLHHELLEKMKGWCR